MQVAGRQWAQAQESVRGRGGKGEVGGGQRDDEEEVEIGSFL